MRALTYLMLVGILATTTACGTRGKLKSPTQIAVQDAKKKAKAERRAEDADDDLMLPQSSSGQVVDPAQTKPDTAKDLNAPKPADNQDAPHVDSGGGGGTK